MRRLLICLTLGFVLSAPAAFADIPPPEKPKEGESSGCQALPGPSPIVPAAAAVVLMSIAAIRKR